MNGFLRQIADALDMPLTSANTALQRLLLNRRVRKRKGVPAAPSSGVWLAVASPPGPRVAEGASAVLWGGSR